MTEEQRVKLLLSYDVPDDDSQPYYQFMVGEFMPAAQAIGLFMTEALHTMYGDYPNRLISFVARDYGTLKKILASPEWQQLEERLKQYADEYEYRIVPYRDRLQL